jgi:hypothetical protein
VIHAPFVALSREILGASNNNRAGKAVEAVGGSRDRSRGEQRERHIAPTTGNLGGPTNVRKGSSMNTRPTKALAPAFSLAYTFDSSNKPKTGLNVNPRNNATTHARIDLNGNATDKAGSPSSNPTMNNTVQRGNTNTTTISTTSATASDTDLPRNPVHITNVNSVRLDVVGSPTIITAVPNVVQVQNMIAGDVTMIDAHKEDADKRSRSPAKAPPCNIEARPAETQRLIPHLPLFSGAVATCPEQRIVKRKINNSYKDELIRRRKERNKKSGMS